MSEGETALELGPYRTLERIGLGGMGAVYLAQRSDGEFRQRVAVKVVPRGLQDEESLERFRRERRILARLEDPRIARLLDGGITDDGRPYIVMEYVEGEPLTRWCDRRRLGVDARLQLFCRVCEAVEYAHRNLVVHRDLKPSNVLVDAQGSVKLLDFGIAALLGGGEEDATGAPAALTLEYASPEQARGEPVSTTSDVYSLGVMLCELLSGHRPYELAERSIGGLERALAEGDATPPSLAAGRPLALSGAGSVLRDVSTAELAARRDSTPARLRSRLRGDLDAICLAALSPQPEHRYASVAALRADVEAHLASLPVSVRPRTVPYRVARFAARHRVPVVAATLALTTVLSVGLGLMVQSRELAAERDRARRVASLFVDLFHRTAETGAPEPTALELLGSAQDRIDALEGQPELQAQLLAVTGRVYQRLGLLREASPLLERALSLRRATGEPGDVAESTAHLGWLRADQSDFDGAERLLREALAMARARDGEDDAVVAELMSDLGSVLQRRGDHDGAEELLGESLALRRRLHGEESAEFADALNALGMLFYARGDYAGARQRLERAAELRRRHHGESHPLLADTLNNLASALGRLGEHEAAEAAQRETLAIRRRALDPDHPSVATSLNNLALILYAQGRTREAVPLLRESLEKRRRRLGDRHADTAQSLSNLGLMLQTLGERQEAEALYTEALAIRRRAYGPEHMRVAQSLGNLGRLLQERGELERSEPLLRDAAAMLRRLLGGEHPMVASGANNLASLLDAQGRLDEAEELYREALAIRRRALPADHPHVAYALDGMGHLLLRRGRLAAAREALAEAVAIRRSRFGDDHPLTARVRSALGEVLVRLGETESGEAELLAARSVFEAGGAASAAALGEVDERLALLAVSR